MINFVGITIIALLLTTVYMIWVGFVTIIVAFIYRKCFNLRTFDKYHFRFWLATSIAGPFAWAFFASDSGRAWFRKLIKKS